MALNYKIKNREESPSLVEVEMDEIGKLADEFVELLNEEEGILRRKRAIAEKLVPELVKQNRNFIQVRGVMLRAKHIAETIKLEVTKPRG
jgi:hypothetical protein